MAFQKWHPKAWKLLASKSTKDIWKNQIRSSLITNRVNKPYIVLSLSYKNITLQNSNKKLDLKLFPIGQKSNLIIGPRKRHLLPVFASPSIFCFGFGSCRSGRQGFLYNYFSLLVVWILRPFFHQWVVKNKFKTDKIRVLSCIGLVLSATADYIVTKQCKFYYLWTVYSWLWMQIYNIEQHTSQ